MTIYFLYLKLCRHALICSCSKHIDCTQDIEITYPCFWQLGVDFMQKMSCIAEDLVLIRQEAHDILQPWSKDAHTLASFFFITWHIWISSASSAHLTNT